MSNLYNGANLDNIKEMNISAVLKIIAANKGISRIEIASLAEMSCALVTKVLTKLIQKDIVTETSRAAAERGRPKVSLSLNCDKYAMVGLRINRKYISSALCTADGKLLCHYSYDIAFDDNSDTVLSKCFELIELSLSHAGKHIVLGIGVAAPGPLPIEHDRVTALNDGAFSEFRKLPLKDSITEKFGLNVVILHDAHCGALNEYLFCEENNRYHNIVFLATDSGVGAGIIINGQPFAGAGGLAGEIACIPVICDGISRNLGTLLSQSSLAEKCGCDTIEEVLEKVREEDAVICEHFDEFIKHLAIPIANFVFTISPDAIVISDRIALLPERVERVCKSALARLLPDKYIKSFELIVRPYSKHSVLRGACGAVLHKALDEPVKFFSL